MIIKQRHNLPILLLFLGVFIILWATFSVSQVVSLGVWERLIYMGCFIVCASYFVFNQELSSEKLDILYQTKKLKEAQQKQQLAEENLEQKFELLEKKEKKVWEKLLLYQHIEFYEESLWSQDNKTYHHEKEIRCLLNKKVESFFDKIINKKYYQNKQFKSEALTKDIVDLIESVAKVHHPESENPLLETSIENLLRSMNGLSLQLLVFLDQLPLNIKEKNLKNTYNYIQKGVKSYTYYKAAEPFLSFTKYLSPVARVAAGVNPITVAVTTVAMEAGKQVIKKGSESYAINMLHDIVGIISDQASNLFSDDYRYHTKQWIYAIELVEIIYYFSPLDENIKERSIKQISGLIFRCEYDRLFLYRCLAEGKSANPERFKHYLFEHNERQEIKQKLEQFIEKNIVSEHSKTLKKVISWRKTIEKRLNIVIELNLDNNDLSHLKNLLSTESPTHKISPSLARIILNIMEDEEKPYFLYNDISLISSDDKNIWLLGTNKRLLIISANDHHPNTEILWYYNAKQHDKLLLERIKQTIADDCKITGGVSNNKQSNQLPKVIIKGKTIGSFESYFCVLIDFLRQ